MPDGNGLEIVPKIKATRSSPEIIVITGLGDPDEAEFAIRTGAWDYLEKPTSFETLKLHIIRVLEYRAEKKSGKPPIVLKRKGIIGSSPKITSCLELLGQPPAATSMFSSPAKPEPGKSFLPRLSIITVLGPKEILWSLIARRFPRRWWKAFFSGTRGGLSPEPNEARRG
jgi:two-component system NtrC family response regulator